MQGTPPHINQASNEHPVNPPKHVQRVLQTQANRPNLQTSNHPMAEDRPFKMSNCVPLWGSPSHALRQIFRLLVLALKDGVASHEHSRGLLIKAFRPLLEMNQKN